MSHYSFAAAAIIALSGAALTSPSFAQGRHDDKPHGTAKPAPRSKGHPPPHLSGRHSDMMHGPSSMRPQDGQTGGTRPPSDAAAKPPTNGNSATKPADGDSAAKPAAEATK